MKFGGTSVDGAARLRAVAEIVRDRLGEHPVVVTSAMAGVTNTLEKLLRTAQRGDRAALDDGLAALRARHLDAAADLAPAGAARGALDAALEDRLRELRVLLRGTRLVAATGGPAAPQTADAVLGFGELLAQELLGAALAAAGVRVAVVDSRDVVVTDERFGAAQPDVGETARRAAERVTPRVAEGAVPVLGGYLGATRAGVPTTLGRGGSDLSASVLGLALGARAIEIWTDVDGMLTADPRTVPHARLLPRVTFREAAELAGLGAKVLHPASIDPAIQGGIEVFIRNSMAPGHPATSIGPSGAGEGAGAIRAVASRGQLELLGLRAPGRLRVPGFLSAVVARLDAAGLVPFLVELGPLGLEFLLPAGPELEAVTPGLVEFGTLFRQKDVGMVAVVGEGLTGRADLWSRVLALAGRWRVRRIGQGTRGASLILVVDEADRDALVRALHDELVAA